MRNLTETHRYFQTLGAWLLWTRFTEFAAAYFISSHYLVEVQTNFYDLPIFGKLFFLQIFRLNCVFRRFQITTTIKATFDFKEKTIKFTFSHFTKSYFDNLTGNLFKTVVNLTTGQFHIFSITIFITNFVQMIDVVMKNNYLLSALKNFMSKIFVWW